MSRTTAPRVTARRPVAAVLTTALAAGSLLVTATPAAAATWTISGEIGNWDASLVGTDVYVVLDDGSTNGVTVDIFDLSGPTFMWDSSNAPDPADLIDGQYTLYFNVDDSAEFIDGYLGGKLDDEYADVTWLDADPVADVDAGTFDLIEAQYIEGTVIGNGAELPGIEVWAEDADIVAAYGGMWWPFTATTDAFGEYRIKVAAEREYIVSVDDPAWIPQTYELQNGCGCSVVPTLVLADPPPSPPTTGIDFDLVDASTATSILGVVADEFSDPIDGLEVRLFRAVGTSWTLVDLATSSFTGFSSFEFLLTALGDGYRVQYVDADGDILEVIDGATTPDLSTFTVLDPLPACFAELGAVTSDLAVVAIVDPNTAAGHCATLAAAPPSGGGGSAPRPRPRVVIAAAVATPTPTPSATPTTSPTPGESASPTPSATAAPEVPPASGPDLWWLLWVLLGVVVVVAVGGVVYVVRRS